VIQGAAWHRHSARFDSFAGANSDGQSSGNRLVNVTTPTTALKAQSTNHENDGEWLQTRPGERCLIRVRIRIWPQENFRLQKFGEVIDGTA
jgi:hypothetical protein